MAALKKISIALLLAFIVLFAAGKIADRAYHRFWRIFYDKLDVIYNDSTNYDAVYLGNSTVHFGINPYYIDSITRLNTFNIGFGGANIESIDMLFHSYLVNHPKPKVALLSIDYSLFGHNSDYTDYFLFFDYLKNKYVKNYLQGKGCKTGLVEIFPFLKYAYFDDYNRGCVINGFKKNTMAENAITYKGFINNKGNGIGNIKMKDIEMDGYKPVADSNNVALFYKLLEYCKQNQIKLVLVFPPRLYISPGSRFSTYEMDTLVQNAVNLYSLPYKRYDTPALFAVDEFTDEQHLNKQGARHYSILLAQYIDSCIRN